MDQSTVQCCVVHSSWRVDSKPGQYRVQSWQGHNCPSAIDAFASTPPLQGVWSRALGLPIERPKSLTIKAISDRVCAQLDEED